MTTLEAVGLGVGAGVALTVLRVLWVLWTTRAASRSRQRRFLKAFERSVAKSGPAFLATARGRD